MSLISGRERKAAWADGPDALRMKSKTADPIALATDRLKKKYRPAEEDDGDKFDDYLSIITRQVNDIGAWLKNFPSCSHACTGAETDRCAQAVG